MCYVATPHNWMQILWSNLELWALILDLFIFDFENCFSAWIFKILNLNVLLFFCIVGSINVHLAKKTFEKSYYTMLLKVVRIDFSSLNWTKDQKATSFHRHHILFKIQPVKSYLWMWATRRTGQDQNSV